jgi:hypothetical protein
MSRSVPAPTPQESAVALKEWAGVCDALSDGRQVVLLRKGGVAESRGQFRLEHRECWLYPTWSHEAAQGLRTGFDVPSRDHPGQLAIDRFAVVEWVDFVADESSARRLALETAWTTETVLRRFHYRRPGLWAVAVRVFRRESPWVIEIGPDHAGCQSWVNLESSLSVAPCRQVVDGARFQDLLDRAVAALAGPTARTP